MSSDQRTGSVRSAFASMAGGYVSVAKHDASTSSVAPTTASDAAPHRETDIPVRSPSVTR